LQRRYEQLVMEHLSPAQRVAAGLRSLPALAEGFASTQAAWRFYANENASLPRLAQPLIGCARAQAKPSCRRRLLVVVDWCNLHYKQHASKSDRIALANSQDLGYKLLTALAVSDRDGSPLAPLCLELQAADGVHSTRSERPLEASSGLDGLDPLMRHVESQDLGRELVWIIDREADSVGHYRLWAAAGRKLLVRADEDRRVLHEGRECKLAEVADALKRQGRLVRQRNVLFKGKSARQFVGEATVVLHRPARQHRVGPDGRARHHNVAGAPLSMRLVVSEVRDKKGKLLARWLLLSNLPPQVKAGTVALWYYWRWRIETYHKLLKGAGQQLECWQQETAEALARRLTVSAMAAVVVWQLARDSRPEAQQMREVLVRLSGRQMKRGKKARGFSEPALLAGLGVLVPMLELLKTHDVTELNRLADLLLPRLHYEAG